MVALPLTRVRGFGSDVTPRVAVDVHQLIFLDVVVFEVSTYMPASL
jgi:hypothetical protein